jgi:SAM-dependent methyltransferase
VRPERAPDFDARAQHYDTLRPQNDAWWSRFHALVELGDLRGRRILDIGCGTGQLASALVDQARAKVWGVDPSIEMLRVARERVPRGVGVRQARAEALPFRDAAFDAGLPAPAQHFRPGDKSPRPAPAHWTVTKMMDQHAYMRITAEDDLRVGDMIAFDISHPCLTFDKWRLLPILNADYQVVDLIQTFNFHGWNDAPEVLEPLLFYVLHRASNEITDPAKLGATGREGRKDEGNPHASR